jgi:hypothetical protein
MRIRIRKGQINADPDLDPDPGFVITLKVKIYGTFFFFHLNNREVALP